MGGAAAGILFERIMLVELRTALRELDAGLFAEIKSYNEPPKAIAQLVDILIELFLHKSRENFANWAAKKFVSSFYRVT